MMLDLSPTPRPVISEARAIDERSDEELDALDFGVVALDPDGVILRYNLYESRLARLDRNQVLGRDFFRDVAPCTRGEVFEGRFRRFVADAGGSASERFEYLFDFRFGAQSVTVEMVRVAGAPRYYLLINRRQVLPARPDLPAEHYAVAQRDLAPDESQRGVRRDALEQRVVEVPWSILAALRATCDRLAPETWQLFCTEWGVEWGRRTAIDLESTALEAGAPSLRELSMRDVAALVSGHLARQGWGLPRFDFTHTREGVVVVEVERSALAESAPRARGRKTGAHGDFACHLLAGNLGALLGHLAARRLAVREVACRASGAPTCAFVAVSAARRAALDAALESGARGVDPVRAALRQAGPGGVPGGVP